MKLRNIITTILLLTVLHATSTSSFNILGIYPYQGKSHFLVFRVFLRELSNRGHNVTVISHFPEKDPPKNYHDISLAGAVKTSGVFSTPEERSIWFTLKMIMFVHEKGVENCEVMLENEEVQRIVREKQKFDVVLVEQFNSDCGLGIAYKLGAPVVGTTSHSLVPYHFQRFGIPSNPSFVSSLFLEGGTNPTLLQRIQRFMLHTFVNSLYILNQRSNKKVLEKYLGDVPSLEDLARDIKFLLVYNNFVLTGSKLLPANVIEVGGYHVSKSQPLSGDLKKFVDEAEDGIIYISFGSVLKSSAMSPEKVEAILEAIKEFPQRVIWKWENKTILSSDDKLYTSNWLPQVDILGHPKTLVFISHAGLGGTTEAIHFGVPMIAMPNFGDQPSNAAAIEESQFGVQLQFKDLTKENLVNSLNKVLDPKFRENAKRVTKAWHDRPMKPLDTAVFWTEFAARHPDLTFRSAAADVPFYKYFNLDILGILVVTIFILGYSILMCCRRQTKVKLQSQKSKKPKRQ